MSKHCVTEFTHRGFNVTVWAEEADEGRAFTPCFVCRRGDEEIWPGAGWRNGYVEPESAAEAAASLAREAIDGRL